MPGPITQTTPAEGLNLWDGYRRARKSYGFFSGLLLAFEIIGFEVPGSLSLAGTKIVLTRPDLVPFVLFALTAFFAFRFTLEWLLLAQTVHAMTPARLDFATAHGIAAVAATLFLIRSATGIALLETVSLETLTRTLVGLLCGLAIGAGIRHTRLLKRKDLTHEDFVFKTLAITLFFTITLTTAVTMSLSFQYPPLTVRLSAMPLAAILFGALVTLLALRPQSSR